MADNNKINIINEIEGISFSLVRNPPKHCEFAISGYVTKEGKKFFENIINTPDEDKEIMNQEDSRKTKEKWKQEEEDCMRRFGYEFKERNETEIIFKKSIIKEKTLSDKIVEIIPKDDFDYFLEGDNYVIDRVGDVISKDDVRKFIEEIIEEIATETCVPEQFNRWSTIIKAKAGNKLI